MVGLLVYIREEWLMSVTNLHCLSCRGLQRYSNIAKATASATLIPSTAADKIPPA